MRLSKHCFAVTGLGYIPPWSVNAGFIAGRKTTLIVDTGANTQAARTIHGYATAARPGNGLLVLNTERHFDHIGGNSYFQSLGIDIYGHAALVRTEEEFQAEVAGFNAAIEDPARRAAHEASVFYAETRLAIPNRAIDADIRFNLGDCEVEVLLTPGHTPTNLSVWVAEDGVLFCGDCLTNGYLPNLAAGGTGDWREWLGSLDRIERLKPRFVIPGHGAVASGDAVPRMIDQVRIVLQTSISGRA